MKHWLNCLANVASTLTSVPMTVLINVPKILTVSILTVHTTVTVKMGTDGTMETVRDVSILTSVYSTHVPKILPALMLVAGSPVPVMMAL